MPIKQIDVKAIIKEKCNNDPQFNAEWIGSEMEHKIIEMIKSARKDKGLRQDEVAEIMGWQQQNVSRLETMKISPSLNSICKLLAVLGLEVELKPTLPKYDPNFGNDRMCECGHPYYRHFDPYEDWAFVGCKYCGCFNFKEVKID